MAFHTNPIFRNTLQDSMEPQYRYDVQTDVFWVDTLYWIIRTDIIKMDVKHTIRTEYFKFCYLPGIFYLKFEKVTPTKFDIELVREIENAELKKEYYYQVSFTIVAATCPRQITYMDSHFDNAPVHFTMDDMLSVYRANNAWMIKCVVWMTECSIIDNDPKNEQNRHLKTELEKLSPDFRQYEQEMASIMGLDSFDALFSGRQDMKFAEYKTTLLLRSFRYAEKLVDSIIKHKEGSANNDSLEDLGRLLGYIRNGEERCISNKDCTLLYASAFYCGLNYLKLLCSDYIKKNLDADDDVEFFIDVLNVADMINDKELRGYASNWYLKHIKMVEKSVKWNNFKNLNQELARGFQATFLRLDFLSQEEVQLASSLFRTEEDSP